MTLIHRRSASECRQTLIKQAIQLDILHVDQDHASEWMKPQELRDKRPESTVEDILWIGGVRQLGPDSALLHLW